MKLAALVEALRLLGSLRALTGPAPLKHEVHKDRNWLYAVLSGPSRARPH